MRKCSRNLESIKETEMKLIELLRTLDSHTYVRIAVVDPDKFRTVTIIGETDIRGWTRLMQDIKDADCAEYTVTYIHCLWHAQELYIGCMKL